MRVRLCGSANLTFRPGAAASEGGVHGRCIKLEVLCQLIDCVRPLAELGRCCDRVAHAVGRLGTGLGGALEAGEDLGGCDWLAQHCENQRRASFHQLVILGHVALEVRPRLGTTGCDEGLGLGLALGCAFGLELGCAFGSGLGLELGCAFGLGFWLGPAHGWAQQVVMRGYTYMDACMHAYSSGLFTRVGVARWGRTCACPCTLYLCPLGLAWAALCMRAYLWSLGLGWAALAFNLEDLHREDLG